MGRKGENEEMRKKLNTEGDREKRNKRKRDIEREKRRKKEQVEGNMGGK